MDAVEKAVTKVEEVCLGTHTADNVNTRRCIDILELVSVLKFACSHSHIRADI